MAVAIAKVTFMWNPDRVKYRDSGVALYRDIQDFWAAHGFDTEIVDTIGNSGEKVIVLSEPEYEQIDKKNQMLPPQVGVQKKLAQFQVKNEVRK